ncbi:MAG: helix-turn-helix transcriptional regulator [Gammaproteobacteria bacterium]|nr:helix-turn-helix transcriptional regulator [Gammaproteobacteria bacterium]
MSRQVRPLNPRRRVPGVDSVGCPIEHTMRTIGGKWKIPIVWQLTDGTKRFGELRKLLPNITQKMLTTQLRELEAAGVVHRKVFPVVPPHVEYSLTETGRSLKPIFNAMCKWGKQSLGEQ